jgi:transcriptional regulator with XRE-family HTH domain
VTFGDLVREAREAQGLTQQEFAESTGKRRFFHRLTNRRDRLIIEKDDDGIFAYFQRAANFFKWEKARVTPRLDPALLAENCDLATYPNFHMVFELRSKT